MKIHVTYLVIASLNMAFAVLLYLNKVQKIDAPRDFMKVIK